MSTQWGVYPLQGRDRNGLAVAADDKTAVKWFVRWRVDGEARKRTLASKGYARTFRDQLRRAQLNGWPADERGWPIDPNLQATITKIETERQPTRSSLTLRSYCETTWWPTMSQNFVGKNRVGHGANMRMALDLIVYREGDPRVDGTLRQVGGSVHLADLVADDLSRAVVERAGINLRTASVNERRVTAAFEQRLDDVDVAPEQASKATVRSFYITLVMIVKDAKRSGHVIGDPSTDWRDSPRRRPSSG